MESRVRGWRMIGRLARPGALAAAVAVAAGACGGKETAEEASDAPFVMDTQYVTDSLGNQLMFVTRKVASRVRVVEPRAGSGDPEAPGAVEALTPAEASAFLANARPPALILDLRDARTYLNQGALPGAFLIEQPRLEESIEDIQVRTDQTILVYGDDDESSRDAARLLASYGFPSVRWLEGGFLGWATADFPVEHNR